MMAVRASHGLHTSLAPKSGSVRNSLRSDSGRFFFRFRHQRRVAIDGDHVKNNSHCTGNGNCHVNGNGRYAERQRQLHRQLQLQLHRQLQRSLRGTSTATVAARDWRFCGKPA